ncbi:hypothetical protein RHODOSMS8_02117 [Rhodobiaceae bacterium]|nr:hypothetical protein RHODOSMS8_02117 [Rhodobiaceae bacterium]
MIALNPSPRLGRYVPAAIFFALAVHGLVLGVFFFSPPSGGGGGQVLGQLSVRLGGTGATGSVEQAAREPVIEVPSLQPEPRLETPTQRVVETIAPKPRVVQAMPIDRRPVEVPRVTEPVEQEMLESQALAEQGDGHPVGTSNAGTPNIGEGAVSQTAGIGASDANAGGERDAYLALIRARIEQNRTYPSAARRRREEGMATLKITIDGQGHLTDVRVITGSGSFHLDRAARRMVEKSAPFPPPPVAPFSTQIPIIFALR